MSKSSASIKLTPAQRRTYRTRNKIRRVNNDRVGVRETRPRLSVYRSDRQIYAQVICDVRGITLAAASTMDKEIKEKLKTGANADAAMEVGKLVALRAKKAGVSKIVFDRGRYIYHGRVKALAEGARSGGLEF
jgi:large subunit ribosomal protein L18